MQMYLALFLLLLSLRAAAQSTSAAPPPPSSQPGQTQSATSIQPDLDRLQTAVSQTNATIAQLRIEKWKADGNSKRQAQSNANSIQRNLSSALPGIIATVRSSPQDLGAEFKLYRNLNALYDVLISLTESAGAFGPKNDYVALGQQLDAFDNIRRSLGDSLERATASTQSQLEQLRMQVRTLEAAASAAPPPKKTVVEDTEPAKKTSTPTAHKRKTTPKKPAGAESSTTSTTTGDSGGSSSPPK